MMNDRSQYEDDEPESSDLNLEFSKALGFEGKSGQPAGPRVAEVWIYPQRISRDEYFRGAWVSLRVAGDEWEIDQNEPARPKPSVDRPKSILKTKAQPKKPADK